MVFSSWAVLNSLHNFFCLLTNIVIMLKSVGFISRGLFPIGFLKRRLWAFRLCKRKTFLRWSISLNLNALENVPLSSQFSDNRILVLLPLCIFSSVVLVALLSKYQECENILVLWNTFLFLFCLTFVF